MIGPDRSRVLRLADAVARIPGPAGEHAVSLLQRGTLNVKLSCPVRPNQQTPHAQDEVYVIVRGRGVLIHDGNRDEFGSGDLLFVASGTEHVLRNGLAGLWPFHDRPCLLWRPP